MVLDLILRLCVKLNIGKKRKPLSTRADGFGRAVMTCYCLAIGIRIVVYGNKESDLL